jgi:hypothetical protein
MVAEFKAPVELNDTEIDAVAGGLVDVVVVDFVEVERNDVTVQVAAGAAVAVLSRISHGLV